MLKFGIAMTIAIVGSVFGDFLVKEAASPHQGRILPGMEEKLRRRRMLRLIGGIGLLTIHFMGYLLAMKLAPVTVVVPLMSCTYVLTTLLAWLLLHERVGRLRWAGIGVIMVGVALLGLST